MVLQVSDPELRGFVGGFAAGDYGYFVHTGDGIGDPMPIYIVEFTPGELWGVRAEPGANTLYAELFEAYLQPAEEIP